MIIWKPLLSDRSDHIDPCDCKYIAERTVSYTHYKMVTNIVAYFMEKVQEYDRLYTTGFQEIARINT